MKYPYLKYSDKIDIHPVFINLTGNPLIVDLSINSKIYQDIDILDQQQFQKYLDKVMKDKYTWGVSGYLDNREKVLSNYPQMIADKRFYHLGLDIIVPLHTPLFTPLDSKVKETGYEKGEGNYGGYVLLMHKSDNFETFYSFYGHLCKDQLPSSGQNFEAGEQFALIGNFHENGNWFYHTHLQIITQKGLENGYISKGYCSSKHLAVIDELCPSPLPLFRR